MKVRSESEVAQSCLTRSDPMDCSLPGSSVHGIFQAGVLKWGAIAFSGCSPVGSVYLSIDFRCLIVVLCVCVSLMLFFLRIQLLESLVLWFSPNWENFSHYFFKYIF